MTSPGRSHAWDGSAPSHGTIGDASFDRDATVDGLFSRQAAASPNAVAVTDGDIRMTYGELEARSNRVANRLRAQGVREGGRVGVALERCIDVPAVLLGVLKAGAAYVPLDRAYPHERLRWMIDDAAIAVTIVDDEQDEFAAPAGAQLTLAEALRAADDFPPGSPHGAATLAYVMYTSGSTGRPKGVAIEHRGIVRLVRGADYVTIRGGDTFLQYAPLGFDASTFEIWAPLLNGARLAVPAPGLHAIDDLRAVIERCGVTTMFLTTALFERLVDESPAMPASLRQLLTGGEVASPSHMRRFVASSPACRLTAVYGPTENTTFSTWCDVASDEAIGTVVPIGTPIAHSTAYVLDAEGREVPPGVVGELCVGGDGVARGYLNLPELTAERFVADPFAQDPPGRLYRTGDRARRRDDGLLEFVGRDDHQVKVRGYRIELGEIETALRSHEGVRAATVIVVERDRAKEIVAHVVPAMPALDERGLRTHLAHALPAYMLPHRIVLRAALPLSANGKVDRTALAGEPIADARPRSARPNFAPQSRTDGLQADVAGMWSAVLGHEPAADDNFFDAGGDSLRLLTLHGRIRERFTVDVQVTDLFEHCTIKKLAAFIAAAQSARP